jgi:hypothetical protein
MSAGIDDVMVLHDRQGLEPRWRRRATKLPSWYSASSMRAPRAAAAPVTLRPRPRRRPRVAHAHDHVGLPAALPGPAGLAQSAT